MNTTAPEPPKGRRWLEEGETIRKWDRFHPWPNLTQWRWATCIGANASCSFSFSRAIRRKTNRKQLK